MNTEYQEVYRARSAVLCVTVEDGVYKNSVAWCDVEGWVYYTTIRHDHSIDGIYKNKIYRSPKKLDKCTSVSIAKGFIFVNFGTNCTACLSKRSLRVVYERHTPILEGGIACKNMINRSIRWLDEDGRWPKVNRQNI